MDKLKKQQGLASPFVNVEQAKQQADGGTMDKPKDSRG